MPFFFFFGKYVTFAKLDKTFYYIRHVKQKKLDVFVFQLCCFNDGRCEILPYCLVCTVFIYAFQLFRRVAAALPGLDKNKDEDKPNEVQSLIKPKIDDEPQSSCGC